MGALEFFRGDALRARLFLERYALRGEGGEVLEEEPPQMWERLAREISRFDPDPERALEGFRWLLWDFRFVPGGRIMFAAGSGRRATLANCYLIPIREDSVEGIMGAALEAARTFSYGGGVGVDLSILRPRGEKVSNAALTSSGAASFMELFSQVTGTIGQMGRRGALMLTLHCAHPDAFDFVRAKADPDRSRVRYANVSLLVEDSFVEAVLRDDLWEMWYPAPCTREELLDGPMGGDVAALAELMLSLERLRRKALEEPLSEAEARAEAEALPTPSGLSLVFMGSPSPYYLPGPFYLLVGPSGVEVRRRRVYRRVRARELWDELVHCAFDSAEPGVIFISRARRFSTTEYAGMGILSTNPCSEVTLEPYGCCCLGSLNLSAFVVNPFSGGAQMDLTSLGRAIRWGVRFLDDALEAGLELHPLPQQRSHAAWGRRIGLGVTGLADALVKLGIEYGSLASTSFCDDLFSFIRKVAYVESALLARERGTFPAFDPGRHFRSPFFSHFGEEMEVLQRFGLRNCALLTCPPVGSGSLLAGTSSGIEPIFHLRVSRRVESLGEEVLYEHPLLGEWRRLRGFEGDPAELPPALVTAHRVEARGRVSLQGTIQRHVDQSISSTVNLPRSAGPREVEEVFLEAWRRGCKGITVYREGSRPPVLRESPHDPYSGCRTCELNEPL